jgi:hypothetical protein
MAKRGGLGGERAKKIPGGSRQAVQKNAASRGTSSFRGMTYEGLLLARSSSTGKRLAAIDRELARRDSKLNAISPLRQPAANANSHAQGEPHRAKPLQGGSHENIPSSRNSTVNLDPLPGYQVDALGRQRPISHRDGAVADVERVDIEGHRIKRDREFRARVLGKYGIACVICGYSAHVEAAHLKPKHLVSDDRTENGAPLCPNHHWELDHGKLDEVTVRRAREKVSETR